ncbi:MAG: hypothetical protein QM687_01240 [Ferruginibacter sp.]
MSTTQVSQTLYRFVSVRPPQMTEEEGKNKRFIFWPEPEAMSIYRGFFAQTINNSSEEHSLQQLQIIATDFKTSSANYIESISDIKELLGEPFYNFATWLAANRNTMTVEKLTALTADLSAIESYTTIFRLWDNLFYQVITQSSFYIKDALIQVLTANHVLANMTHPEIEDPYTYYQQLVNAKLVLPADIFSPIIISDQARTGGFETDPDTETDVLITPPVPIMKAKQTVLNAERENSILKSILKKVEIWNKEYTKLYEEEYKSALNSYEDQIQNTTATYEADKNTALQNWCAIRDNSIPYNENDPCQNPVYIPEPVYPKFNFSPSQNWSSIMGELTEEEKNLIINDIDESPTYLDFLRKIEELIYINDEIILNNTITQAKEIAFIGGYPVALNNDLQSSNIGVLKYQACPRVNGEKVKFDIAFKVPDTSWQFEYIQYTNSDPNNGYSTYANVTQENDTIFLIDLFADSSSPFLINIFYEKVEGTIHFTNWQVYRFVFSLQYSPQGNYLNTKVCYTGNLIANVPLEDQEESKPELGFIPSGYGLKQLGIADYRKVEQSVHCYVEGEVAHIENIMAREYKEKSTRRLKRNEITNTTTTESESEQLTDTTSTSRFEMQNEIARMMQESKDFSAGTSFGGKLFGANASYATHNSKEESIRNAVTEARDLTERAMERIVSKVKEERIEKIIEEFEENNKHGFDNTLGDKHVVGVYRWVDKVYKNQIYNYGKRLMFEFMVPEPGRLHKLGMLGVNSPLIKTLTMPVDPRTAPNMKIDTFAAVSDVTAKYWGAIFNIEVPSLPEEYISVGKAFSYTAPDTNKDKEWDEVAAGNAEIQLPEGYTSVSVTASHKSPEGSAIGSYMIGGEKVMANGYPYAVPGFTGTFPVSFSAIGYHAGSVNFKVELRLTNAAKKEWQQKTFKLIIDSYTEALKLFEEEKALQEQIPNDEKATNAAFYRQIENTILRKNCISYLVDQKQTAALTYGKQMYQTTGAGSFKDYEVNVSKQLDDYAAFVKFLEQAFEWDIMSYNFYPYYWGNRQNWLSLYQYDNMDPLFRSFMQSGIARVVVTVRPGFEDAVRFYLQTGMIWSGGEVPVIDDPLYLSIIDELKQPVGVPEGKAWATRLPTSLTILQADSIGLKVEKALPCNCDDVTPETWESPESVPCGDNFEISTGTLNGNLSPNKIEFVVKGIETEATIGDMDALNLFPRSYRCMGHEFIVERNAAWNTSANTTALMTVLAARLSQINGVSVVPETVEGNSSCLRFTIDGALLPLFSFGKPAAGDSFDTLTVFTTAATVQFEAGAAYVNALLDKAGEPVTAGELNTELVIGRFK